MTIAANHCGMCAVQRALPDKKEAEDDERDIDERVAEQEHVEHAARIFAENAV